MNKCIPSGKHFPDIIYGPKKTRELAILSHIFVFFNKYFNKYLTEKLIECINALMNAFINTYVVFDND